MGRVLFAGAVIAQLVACGGKDNNVTTPGALAGTWAYTAAQCGGGPGPAAFAPNFAAGRTWKLITADGYAGSIALADSTCTIAGPYGLVYPSAGTVIISNSGSMSCTPSATACATLSTALFARDVCNVTLGDTVTFAYTTVPTTVGGTMTMTVVSANTHCSDESLPNPLRFIWTKQ